MVWYGMALRLRAPACPRGQPRVGAAYLVPPRKDELELERARVVRRERHEPLAPTIPRRVGYQWGYPDAALARDAGAEGRRRIQSLAVRRHVCCLGWRATSRSGVHG